MSIEEYNNELTKIKQFHSFLTKILDDGYINDIDDLKKLTDQINNINMISNTYVDFIDDNQIENIDNQIENQIDNQIDSDYDCIPFIPSKYNKKHSSSTSPSSSDTEEESEEESEDKSSSKYKSPINKEQEKIERFIKNSEDIFLRCSNISLYKVNGFDYIDNMKKFMNKTFIY
jgi:hypothetical protein